MQEEEINIKRQLRKAVLARRDALSEDEQKRAEALITERICSHSCFTTADNLLAFVSYGSEIRTTQILMQAWKLGKKVYVPKVEGNVMFFYRIESLEELVEGYKGILEPEGDSESFQYVQAEADRICMLVPGVAFDKERNRMGYGKGFYDRFLGDKQELQFQTIGICHTCQMVESLPAEKWDIKPQEIVVV